MRVRFLPYGPSQGLKALALATGIKRLSLVRTKFRPRPSDLIINWGRSDGLGLPVRYLNPPPAVRIASSKLRSLQAMKEGEVNVPDFTTEIREAARWLGDGDHVVVRRVDRGSAGVGIELVSPKQYESDKSSLPPAPLYTRYVPKYDEYRLHVFAGQVIDFQQKRRRKDVEVGKEGKIRNAQFGWVFCRDGVSVPDGAISQAILAVQACGLDFGAVDLGWTRKYSRATVYEVNTAPGLEGSTVQCYAEAIKRLVAAKGDYGQPAG